MTAPTRPARPAPAEDDAEDLAVERRRLRPTAWAGAVFATAIVAVALWAGAHLSVLLPGLAPAWLAGLVAVAGTWLVVAVLGWCACELLARHHRAMAAAAWRHTKRAGAWAGHQASHRDGALRRLLARLAAWAEQHRRGREENSQPAAGPDPPGGAAGTTAAVVLEPEKTKDPAGAPASAETPAAAPAATGTTNGDTTMATGAATPVRHGAPARWAGPIGDATDFDPSDDTELLEYMAGEVAGMLGYGEAIAEMHEHCVAAVRLDPAAMAMVHDCAEAVAEAAGVMASAINRFKEVYDAPRGFVADGGVLPRDGDFLTGEDES